MTARATAALSALLVLAPSLVAAQRAFEQPREPCDVKTGHFLVNGAMLHLKVDVETDNERTRGERLDEAHDVLIRAIRDNNQADNPGAWYYLGRYYVERADPFGADSAFGKVVAVPLR